LLIALLLLIVLNYFWAAFVRKCDCCLKVATKIFVSLKVHHHHQQCALFSTRQQC